MSYKAPLSEPIAIVGSSCRFAGGATSPSKLWTVLSNPPDLSKEVPKSRFNAEAFYHTDGEHHGATNSTKGYWLEDDPRMFDNTFFSINPKEAEAIDPQQRLLLEVVYEALESTGYAMEHYAGRRVAVFAGLMTGDYDTLSQRDDIFASQYSATGNARSILSNRISYFFDFKGPSMTIDTACSASLVALHQAVLSLRAGESEVACVAGANLMFTPEQFIAESSLHMLSPTGKSRMWDASADGYARGEGVAALFLKPLARAIADGDRIEAIVRESGVNSDGRTAGITQPNADAQSALIVDTYKRSGLDPYDAADRCQYFEAHGTGTQVGDPTEASAISRSFFRLSPETAGELLVGSVKTVIGHTEGAAGLAGVLKTIQAMHNCCVPPNLHLENLNPRVKRVSAHLHIPTVATPWPKLPPDQPLRASVNSFGFGGTNAHVILELYNPKIHGGMACGETVAPLPSQAPVTPSLQLPLVLSATTQKSLSSFVRLCQDYLDKHPSNYNKLAWTLFHHRTSFPYRVLVPWKEEALGKLAKKASNGDVGTRTKSPPKANVLGVFTGQGAQWPTMGAKLLNTSRVFQQSIKMMDAVLQRCPDPPTWSLTEALLSEDTQINVAEWSQPLCTAVQVALVDLLRSIGVQFHTVVGHSSGEIAAAYAAGKISAENAVLIAYYRGFVAQFASGPRDQEGRMLATGLSREEASALCGENAYAGRVVMAASNSPTRTTLSGNSDAITEVKGRLQNEGILASSVSVDKAYHSHHMDEPSRVYTSKMALLDIVAEQGNGIKWVSSVGSVLEGGQVRTDETLAGKYWAENMREPVLFYEALSTALHESGPFTCAIEVGPHPIFRGPVAQAVAKLGMSEIPYTGVLRRKEDDRGVFSDFLGFMWQNFGPSTIDMGAYIRDSSDNWILTSRLMDLPSYPWDHSLIHWRESRVSRQYHHRPDPVHELLGVRTRDDTEFQLRWRNYLKLNKLPWTEGHKFQGTSLLPASAYCVMALDAARVVVGSRQASIIELQNLEFIEGVTMENDAHGVEVLFSLTIHPQEKDPSIIDASFHLASAPGHGKQPMKKSFSGNLRIHLGEQSADSLPHRPTEFSEMLPVSTDMFYKSTEEIGLLYTGPFRALQSIDRRFNFSSGRLKKYHDEDTTSLRVSPATLDSCFQCTFAAFQAPGDKSAWTSFLPKAIERIKFNMATCDRKSSDEMLQVDCDLTQFMPMTKDNRASFTADMLIYNDAGEMEIQVEGLTVSSFAVPAPDDDYELYLHTSLQVDPEDEILQANTSKDFAATDLMLLEDCLRVASFYLRGSLKTLTHLLQVEDIGAGPLLHVDDIATGAWARDTEEAIDEFITNSPYFPTLDFIRKLGKSIPEFLPGCLPRVFGEATQLHHFQSHLTNVIKQLVHRYPRMNVLSLTDPQYALSEHVLAGLGESFVNFTIGSDPESNIEARLPSSDLIRKKVRLETVDFATAHTEDEDAVGQHHYDLVVVSTTVIDGPLASKAALGAIRNMMTPGGFLILIDAGLSLKGKLRRFVGEETRHSSGSSTGMMTPKTDEPLTPPDWPDFLDQCGFVNGVKGSHQFCASGFSLVVRQSADQRKMALQNPLGPAAKGIPGKVVIIGGISSTAGPLSVPVREQLCGLCSEVVWIRWLDNLTDKELENCSAILVLADIDAPVFTNMSEHRLELLKKMFSPQATVLWITHNARTNPDHAGSFAFARSILAEVPGLILQMLDLDSLSNQAGMVVEALLRLDREKELLQKKTGDLFWNHEPELFIENGRRLVPRVLPYSPGVERVNAMRRVISKEVNSLGTPVKLVSSRNDTGTVFDAIPDVPTIGDSQDNTQISVDYTSVNAVQIGGLPYHVCLGHDLSTGDLVVALVDRITSSFSAPVHAFARVQRLVAGPVNFLAALLRIFVALNVATVKRGSTLILLDPDQYLTDSIHATLEGKGVSVRVVTTNANIHKANPSYRFLHPMSTAHALSQIFPPGGAHIISFLDKESKVAALVRQLLPATCTLVTKDDILLPSSAATSSTPTLEVSELLKSAVGRAVTILSQFSPTNAFAASNSDDTISVNELLTTKPQLTAAASPFRLVDWGAERTVSCVTKPLVENQLFSKDKTYVLVGLTRDLGQSLCRLFAAHGARYIVLSSRNPNPDVYWTKELAATQGVDVRIERLDVTSLEAVKEFKRYLAEDLNLPPVGGVINGAMVLEDRIFADMDLETWNKVLRPKTVGSSNLDVVFDGPEVDFFLMTSSFAATGGHAAQSNYAVANNYMNGLAARRRSRGLPASAINIGVIYGLGLLHRDARQHVYDLLARDGYPPISERDIHHMVIEAIVGGRPPRSPYTGVKLGPGIDLTTGLSRYDPARVMQHWQRDPRFGHFTLRRQAAAGGVSADGGGDLQHQVGRASSNEEAFEMVFKAFQKELERLLHVESEHATPERSLAELGTDSLGWNEIRNWFSRAVGVNVSQIKIGQAESLGVLVMDAVVEVREKKGE